MGTHKQRDWSTPVSAEELQRRRRWFEQYTERLNLPLAPRRSVAGRVTCPCCGYPTLKTHGHFEVCVLCNWEDDGQDDPHADEVWGGPNGAYSLTEARDNFRRFLSHYRPDDIRPGFADSRVEVRAKRAIIEAFEAISTTGSSTNVDDLWVRIHENEQILDRERQRKSAAFERRGRVAAWIERARRWLGHG